MPSREDMIRTIRRVAEEASDNVLYILYRFVTGLRCPKHRYRLFGTGVFHFIQYLLQDAPSVFRQLGQGKDQALFDIVRACNRPADKIGDLSLPRGVEEHFAIAGPKLGIFTNYKDISL